MLPIESETFLDSIKTFISLNKTFPFVSRTYRFQTRKPLISVILQNTKWQTVQHCKTSILNIYILKTILSI